MSTATSIRCLPDEVLSRIFWRSDLFQPASSLSLSDYASTGENVDPGPDPHFPTPPASANVAQVLRIASVCRRWRKLAHESVTTLHVLKERFVSRRDLKRVLASFPNLTRLHLSDQSMETIDNDFLAFIGSSFPNLIALHVGEGIAPGDDEEYDEEETEDFEDSGYPVTTAGLDSLFRRCRRLEQLSLQCLHRATKLPISFFQLTRLHTLSLGGLSPLKYPNLVNLTSLTNLSIQKRDMHLHQLSPLTGLTNLTSLFFPGRTWFHDFEGDFSFGQLTTLRSLGFVQAPTDFPSMFPSTLPCFRLQRLLLAQIQNIPPGELGKRFPALHELCLSESPFLTELPDSLTSISTLEILTISNCSVSSLPDKLGNLTRLKSLVLSMLPMETLPNSIGLLTRLQKLYISCIWSDIAPAAISSLTALESLVIRPLRLTLNPEELGDLTNLRNLELRSCASLQQLPSSLGRLSSLTRLNLDKCPMVNLPEAIGQLGGLRELALSCCNELTELPASITQLSCLETLKAYMCEKLASAPEGMGNLSRLQKLDLWGCVLLTVEYRPWSLEDLRWGNDTSSSTLPEMSTAPYLKKLHLTNVTIKDAAATSRSLSGIEKLELRLGAEQTEISLLLGFLSCLRELRISKAKSLRHLPHDIGTLPQLRQLHVEGAESLQEIPASVGQLVHLTSVHIEAPNLTHLPETISSLSRLGDLSLRNCSSLTSLPCSFTAFTYLHKLDASKTSLHVLPPNFHHWGRLRELDLHDCEQLQFLPQELCCLTMLREVDLRGCKILGSDPVLPDGMFSTRGS